MRGSLKGLLWLLAGLVWLAPAGAEPGAAPAASLRLLYSANLDGELEPCGCTAEGDLGGLRRRASMIERLRAEDPQLILLSAGGLFSASGMTHRITNRFIQQGLMALDYDAVGVQWSDLLYGPDFILAGELPRVASNWTSAGFRSGQRIRRVAGELVFFQWLDRSDSPYAAMSGADFPADEDTTALAAALAEADASGALVVLATSLEPEAARQRLPLERVDLLIARSQYEHYAEPVEMGQTLVLRAGSRGQRLGLLELDLAAPGRIADWRHRVIPLPPGVGDSPSLDDWYQAYSAALMRDYSERIAQGRAANAGTGAFVGEQACQACHAAEHQAWSSSPHAQALEVLKSVNKAFDANCIGCHVLGFGQPGGFVDEVSTPAMANVQCESCHGPARAHAADPGQPPATAELRVCAGCHNPSHSPGFDYDRYWPRIAHGPTP